MAIKHAALLTSWELQDFVFGVVEHLSKPWPDSAATSDFMKQVHEREKNEQPIVGRGGLPHDSPDLCVLRAVGLLLRMTQRRAKLSDYINILNLCASAADMYDMETKGGEFYAEECKYHNTLLKQL